MTVLIAAATVFEITGAIRFLQDNFEEKTTGHFQKDGLEVFLLIHGVGMPATVWHLSQFFAQKRPDLAIQAGIAGVFGGKFALGAVTNVVSERFADLGVEEQDGSFTDLFSLGLSEKNELPFINGAIQNPDASDFKFLPLAKGITVNKVHGNATSIEKIRKTYPDAEVESMEGAAFAYCCAQTGLKYLQVRAISNHVEPRNRANWQIGPAIENLNLVLIELLSGLMIEP